MKNWMILISHGLHNFTDVSFGLHVRLGTAVFLAKGWDGSYFCKRTTKIREAGRSLISSISV